MDAEWCYFENFLNDSECDRIIQDSKHISSFDARIGVNRFENDSSEKVQTDVRRSQIKFVNSNVESFNWVFEKLWHYANLANTKFNFDICNLDFVQIAEYDHSYKGCYVSHKDVFWYQPEEPFSRKLSCTVQLTDKSEYEGGELTFQGLEGRYPDSQEKIAMSKKGTAIFFPSFIEHAVEPVTGGTRKSITAWFQGPKWR